MRETERLQSVAVAEWFSATFTVAKGTLESLPGQVDHSGGIKPFWSGNTLFQTAILWLSIQYPDSVDCVYGGGDHGEAGEVAALAHGRVDDLAGALGALADAQGHFPRLPLRQDCYRALSEHLLSQHFVLRTRPLRVVVSSNARGSDLS